MTIDHALFILFALFTLLCGTIAQLGGEEYGAIFKTVAVATFLFGTLYTLVIYITIKRTEMYIKLFLPGKTNILSEILAAVDYKDFMDRLKYPCVVYLENVYTHQVRRILNSSRLSKAELKFFKKLLSTLETICTLEQEKTEKALELFYQFDLDSLKHAPACPKAQACIKLGFDIQVYIHSAKKSSTSS